MKISVIILSWNRMSEIKKTLEDLASQTFRDYEVIVVDQGSDEDVPGFIEKNFKEVKVVRLPENLGVPGGRNVGAKHAAGEILVFLDNDASLDKHALEKTMLQFEKDKTLGVLGYKILNAFTGELDYDSWVYQKSKLMDVDKSFETYTYCGAGHAIRSEVFRQAGPYWAKLFFAFEEIELSIKIMKKGYRILYDPTIVAHHRTSPEKRFYSPKRYFYCFRNLLWIVWKYYPLWAVLPQTIIKTAAYLVKGAKHRCLWAVIKGGLAALTKPHLLLQVKNRMSGEVWRRYQELSYKGPWLKVIKEVFKY